jgi:hypothetical protein
MNQLEIGQKMNIERKIAAQKKIRDRISVLYTKSAELDEKLGEIKIKYVLSKGLLKVATWRLDGSREDQLVLSSHCKKHEELADVLQEDHHCSQVIAEGVKLRFDDWDISLQFDSFERGIAFIKEQGLQTNLKDFKTKCAALKQSVANLEAFIGLFEKSKSGKK